MLTDMAVLEEKGKAYVADVIASQQQKGLRASGYSASNTHFSVEMQGTTLVLQLIGPSYWKQQQYGRRPNTRRGRPSTAFVQQIRQWIADKGLSIPPEAAGAIAYKIVNEGISVPNRHNPGDVLSEPLDPARISQDITSTLTPLIKQQVRSILFAP